MKIIMSSATHSIHVSIQIFPQIFQKQFQALVTQNAVQNSPRNWEIYTENLRRFYRQHRLFQFHVIILVNISHTSFPFSNFYTEFSFRFMFFVSQFINFAMQINRKTLNTLWFFFGQFQWNLISQNIEEWKTHFVRLFKFFYKKLVELVNEKKDVKTEMTEKKTSWKIYSTILKELQSSVLESMTNNWKVEIQAYQKNGED